MGRVTLTLPRLGETMEEARLTAWRVAPGASYRRGEVLLEVETDKAVVEVPALADGTMAAHLVAEGDTVALDAPIAEVEQAGAAPEVRPAPPQAPAPAIISAAPPPRRDGLRASPAARAAARAAGVRLAALTGTGRNGRITAADVAGGTVTAVLLHGLFDSPMGWRDLPARLRSMGLAVAAPDLPPAPDIDATAAALDLPAGPVILIGHSLGAAVAVRLAATLGDRLAGLILIAPTGLGPAPDAGFTTGVMQATTPADLAAALARLDGPRIGPRALAAELARIAALRPALEPLVASLRDIDIRPDLPPLADRLRVVWGTADRILPWQAVAALPPRAALHLVAGAGHLPHHAAPDLIPHLAARLRLDAAAAWVSLPDRVRAAEGADAPPATAINPGGTT